MVGLTSDSLVLISKLHKELSRNLGPAQPELSANETISPIFRIHVFQGAIKCAAGNRYLVAHETK